MAPVLNIPPTTRSKPPFDLDFVGRSGLRQPIQSSGFHPQLARAQFSNQVTQSKAPPLLARSKCTETAESGTKNPIFCPWPSIQQARPRRAPGDLTLGKVTSYRLMARPLHQSSPTLGAWKPKRGHQNWKFCPWPSQERHRNPAPAQGSSLLGAQTCPRIKRQPLPLTWLLFS